MAGRIKEAIIPPVQTLITHLTGFQEGEENFSLCERFALSNLWHHRFLSVDSHAVRRSIDGIIMKFEVHGHLDTSAKLRELVDEFLSQEVFKDHPQYDIQWTLLSLLLHLANNPTASAHQFKAAPAIVETSHEEDDFDWASYLREGDERFFCNYAESSSDDVDSDSDEQSEEEPIVQVVHVAHSLPILPLEGRKVSKEGLIQNMRDIYLAEEWLNSNVQQRWEVGAWPECNSVSKFPAANLALQWNEHLKDQGKEESCPAIIVTEYKVIRQILFMFYTLNATQLFIESNKKICVKPGITVPSLTKESLESYLNDICPYFEILKEFHSFGEHLIRSDSYPPNTYIAYWNELKEFLNEFNNFIAQLEIKVKKQDGIYTLLKLKEDMEPKLSELRCVHCVHVRAVYDWNQSTNWLSAITLLSVLYTELLDGPDNKHAAIILRLFLKSFQVYLEIIDTLLTDGELIDSKEEFVVTRDNTVQPYERMLKIAGIEPLPALKTIVSMVVHTVSSIDLLVRLDRLPKFNEQGSLFEMLIQCITEGFSKFADKPIELPKESLKKSAFTLNGKNDFFHEIKDHMLYFANPFLLSAFEEYLPFKEQKEETEECTPYIKTKQLFTSIQQFFGEEMLPVKQVLETNLIKLIEKKCKTACCVVKPILQKEFKLLKHFQVIKSVFLMEAGDVMHQFYISLFQQIQSFEATSFSLSIHLRSCVELIFPEFSSHFSVILDPSLQNACSVQEAISSVRLRYSVEWPMSLLLTENNMRLYNCTFQFLLKIKWAIFSLQELRFSDLEQTKLTKREKIRAHRLHILRFWLLHSVNSIHNYLMGQVLNSLGLQLQQNVEEADNLNTLIKAHDVYVQMVYTHCLQTPDYEVVRKPVLQMISTALRLCEVWEAGVIALSDARLSELEELYCKSYIFMAVLLSNWVEIDAVSHLEDLCSAFNPVRLNKVFPIYLG